MIDRALSQFRVSDYASIEKAALNVSLDLAVKKFYSL
jgi:hypothetical protein